MNWECFKSSVIWCFLVVLILLLPYLFSALITIIIDVDLSSETTLFNEFESLLINGVETGSFLFIPISLISAPYLDYNFERKLNTWEAIVHISYFLFLISVIIFFSCVYLYNKIALSENLNNTGIVKENIYSWVRILSGMSLCYAISLKYMVLSFRQQGTNQD